MSVTSYFFTVIFLRLFVKNICCRKKLLKCYSNYSFVLHKGSRMTTKKWELFLKLYLSYLRLKKVPFATNLEALVPTPLKKSSLASLSTYIVNLPLSFCFFFSYKAQALLDLQNLIQQNSSYLIISLQHRTYKLYGGMPRNTYYLRLLKRT